MVDPQSGGVPHRGANRLDQRLVGGGAELPRHKRRQLPVLSGGLKASGGAPTVQPLASMSCHTQASAPPGSKPIGKSCTSGSVRLARGELAIELPLEPLVKAEFRGMRNRETASGGVGWAAILGRPLTPIAAEPLGQGAVQGELHERLALAAAVRVEVRIAGEVGPQRGKGLPLYAKNGVAVDQPLGLHARFRRRQGPQAATRAAPPPGILVHAEIQRIAEAAARRVVRAGRLRHDRGHAADGIDQQQIRP